MTIQPNTVQLPMIVQPQTNISGLNELGSFQHERKNQPWSVKMLLANSATMAIGASFATTPFLLDTTLYNTYKATADQVYALSVSTGTATIIVPSYGIYHIFAEMVVSPVPSTSSSVYVYVNGATLPRISGPAGELLLNPNDSVQFVYGAAGSSSPVTVASGEGNTSASIRYMGQL